MKSLTNMFLTHSKRTQRKLISHVAINRCQPLLAINDAIGARFQLSEITHWNWNINHERLYKPACSRIIPYLPPLELILQDQCLVVNLIFQGSDDEVIRMRYELAFPRGNIAF